VSVNGKRVALVVAALLAFTIWRVIAGVQVTGSGGLGAVPPPTRQLAGAPSDDYFTVLTEENAGPVVTTAPWYVSGLALVGLVAGSGWQLRLSWRDRRQDDHVSGAKETS
jgi:hypothetical protein